MSRQAAHISPAPRAALQSRAAGAHATFAVWALVGTITLAAAVLRLIYLDRVLPDPFYDAAVRSMGSSWHNFFFGAYEPSGSLSIDKPPVDLWLQVASAKIFGFSSTTLKLPEALAGTAAVPLLFETVRRIWNATAGVVAAVALAVLPVDVITSRSDTMDAVMMLVIVLALLCAVRAAETGRQRWLLAAAAAMGRGVQREAARVDDRAAGDRGVRVRGLPREQAPAHRGARGGGRACTWRWRSRGSRPR